MLLLISNVTNLKALEDDSANFNFYINSNIILQCANPTNNDANLKLTLMPKEDVSSFDITLKQGEDFKVSLKEIFEGISSLNQKVLNVSSSQKDVSCVAYEIEKFENDDIIVDYLNSGLANVSYIPYKESLFENVVSKTLEIVNFEDKKVTYNVSNIDSDENFTVSLEPFEKIEKPLEFENDFILKITPNEDNIKYNARLIVDSNEKYVSIYSANNNDTLTKITAHSKILLTNIKNQINSVNETKDNENNIIELKPYESIILEDNNIGILQGENYIVSIIGDNVVRPLTSHKSKLQLVLFKESMALKNELLINNDSDKSNEVVLGVFSDKKSFIKNITLEAKSYEVINLQGDGYVILTAKENVSSFLNVKLSQDLIFSSSAIDLINSEFFIDINDINNSDIIYNDSDDEIIDEHSTYNDNEESDEDKISDTNDYATDLVDATNLVTPYKELSLKEKACETNDCKNVYKEQSLSYKGKTYLIYTPYVAKFPGNAKIYINNVDKKQLKFNVKGYSALGAENFNKNITVKAGKTYTLTISTSVHATYHLAPNDDDINYQAYIIASNPTKGFHYQIKCTESLENTTSFPANGKLILANVNNVPTMIRYKIVSNNTTLYEGDEWVHAKTQRIIDLSKDVNVDNASMNFKVQKYFEANECESNDCIKEDLKDQLVANIIYDDIIKPIENISNRSSDNLILSMPSCDTNMEIFNESESNNDIYLNTISKLGEQFLKISLKPREKYHVNFSDVYGIDNTYELQNYKCGLQASASKMMSIIAYSMTNTGANLSLVAFPNGDFKQSDTFKNSTSNRLPIRCYKYNSNITDKDNDGVCDNVEKSFGLSSSSKDTDNDGISDAQELYWNLSSPKSADSKNVYQDSESFVQNQSSSSNGNNKESTNIYSQVMLSAEKSTSAATFYKLDNVNYKKADANATFSFESKYDNTDSSSTCIQKLFSGIQCGESCCEGTCNGFGYKDIIPLCCNKYEAIYQSNNELGCCKYGKFALKKLDSKSKFTDINDSIIYVDDEECCGVNEAGYPERVSSNGNQESQNPQYLLYPDLNKQMNCCTDDYSACVYDESTSNPQSICCKNGQCGAKIYAYYRSAISEDLVWNPLVNEQHCCDKSAVPFQADGKWGCCPQDKLNNVSSLTYTNYKLSFYGFVKDRNYKMDNEELSTLYKYYDEYLADNNDYVTIKNQECFADNDGLQVTPPKTVTLSPIPSEEPTNEPYETSTLIIHPSIVPSIVPSVGPSHNPTIVVTNVPNDTITPKKTDTKISTKTIDKTTTIAKTKTDTKVYKTITPKVTTSLTLVPGCNDTIIDVNTGLTIRCQGDNPCAVTHGTSTSGGCCPSSDYTWCEGGCCKTSLCLNPYGASTSGGEEKCCKEGTTPCGTISCCESGKCVGSGSNAICCDGSDNDERCKNFTPSETETKVSTNTFVPTETNCINSNDENCGKELCGSIYCNDDEVCEGEGENAQCKKDKCCPSGYSIMKVIAGEKMNTHNIWQKGEVDSYYPNENNKYMYKCVKVPEGKDIKDYVLCTSKSYTGVNGTTQLYLCNKQVNNNNFSTCINETNTRPCIYNFSTKQDCTAIGCITKFEYDQESSENLEKVDVRKCEG